MAHGGARFDPTEGMRLGWMAIQGDSMWPALRSGDEARFVRLTDSPRIGEVVIARLSGRFVAHRVVAVRGDRVTLRGDNRREDDPEVGCGEILGKVEGVRRDGRLVPRWDRGPRLWGRLRLAVKRRVAGLVRRLR